MEKNWHPDYLILCSLPVVFSVIIKSFELQMDASIIHSQEFYFPTATHSDTVLLIIYIQPIPVSGLSGTYNTNYLKV